MSKKYEHISESLWPLAVPVDTLMPDPANPRKHGKRSLDTLKASLSEFHQVKPIIVDQNNIVRAGNGVFEAGKALGWTHIAVVKVNWDATKAVAFSIADNRSAELSEWDWDTVSNILSSLQKDEAITDALGWSKDELSSIIASAVEDEESETPEPKNEVTSEGDTDQLEDAPTEETENTEAPFPSVDDSLKTTHMCPKCGYAWSGKTK